MRGNGKGAGPAMTHREIQTAVTLRRAGTPIEQIARELHRGNETVRRWVSHITVHVTVRCAHCPREFSYQLGVGHRPVYCSPACRRYARSERKRQRALAQRHQPTEPHQQLT